MFFAKIMLLLYDLPLFVPDQPSALIELFFLMQ